MTMDPHLREVLDHGSSLMIMGPHLGSSPMTMDPNHMTMDPHLKETLGCGSSLMIMDPPNGSDQRRCALLALYTIHAIHDKKTHWLEVKNFLL